MAFIGVGEKKGFISSFFCHEITGFYPTHIFVLFRFEIKINVTGEDEWQDVGYEFQYSFRNSETPSDFEIENTGGQLAAFFNSKVTAGVKTLNPNTVYVIEVQFVFSCSKMKQFFSNG